MGKLTFKLLITLFLMMIMMTMFVVPSVAASTGTKLFDPTPMTPSSSGGFEFGSKNVSVTLNPGEIALISSTSDGGEGFIVDNNLLINGTPICAASCYNGLLSLPINGSPAESTFGSVGPIDVTSSIPLGTSNVSFSLWDQGGIGGWYGSSTIYLVITSPDNHSTLHDNDRDGDGISNSRDNCPNDYNPDQEDGWGGTMGDICDTDWYNRTGQQVAGFVQKSNIFHLHGNCIYLEDGAPRCPVIAAFDPSIFNPDDMPMEISSGDAGSWSVWVHFLYTKDGKNVYQVNTYSTDPPQPDTLIDDKLEIHQYSNIWQWYHRGGDSQFHGL